jgi:hypothetical protein
MPQSLARVLALLLLSTLPTAHAATFVVSSASDNNAGDSNPGDGICEDLLGGTRCTLRAAIEEANAAPGFDVINFNVGGFFVLNLQSPLPTITSGVRIDGRTEVGYNIPATDIALAPPRVYLSGAALAATPTADGLRIGVGGGISSIQGLGLINFPDAGIEASDADAIRINNCWIGLAANGAIAGNGVGIVLNRLNTARVGRFIIAGLQQLDGLGNIISANDGDGIRVLVGEGNLIAGNRIGTSPDGLGNRGNGGDGIELVGPNNEVGTAIGLAGGGTLRAGNLIAFNAGHGVNAPLGGQQIETNQLVANGGAGVLLAGTGSNVGFTAVELQGNVIRGNGGAGVQLSGSAHLVENNTIFQNAGRGVDATGGSGHAIRFNPIYANGGDGVRLGSSTSEVQGNEIGRNGNVLAPNLGDGVLLEAGGNLVTSNHIGGAPGSQGDGIEVRSGSANEIAFNLIGVHESANIGNAGFGVRVGAASTGTVIQGNHIGLNGGGIALLGSGTRVCNNKIGGLSTTGLVAGNFGEGIYVEGTGNIIGAAPLGCNRNLITHNVSTGIIVRGSGHVIADNTIGQFQGGNGSGGIKIDVGAGDNSIVRNALAHNVGDGVRVVTGAGTGNRIESNAFDSNSGIGIDLGDDGITGNDSSDNDAGPNNLQNHPIWTGATPDSSPGRVRVDYWVDTALANATYPLQVQFYLSGGLRQGVTHLHTATYPTVGTLRFAIITLPPGVFSGTLTAIVTDDDGSTSEFSDALPFAISPVVDDVFRDGFEAP